MPRIPISAELKAVLLCQGSPVELVDDEGNFVGHYLPPGTLSAPGEEWPTGEEIAAKAKSAKRYYTTSEVIAHLRSLG
jgi:hypothetical protein